VTTRDAFVDVAKRATVVARTEKVEKTKYQPTPVGNYLYTTISFLSRVYWSRNDSYGIILVS